MSKGIEATFFADVDANSRLRLDSEEALWRWVADGATAGLTTAEWPLLGGDGTYFRGQSSSAYGLTSRLYRDVRFAAESSDPTRIVSEADLKEVEATLLLNMRREGLGRRMTDGELLMVMQHHGIATRLLDVSATPKEALFFACDQHGDQDGRFFTLSLYRDDAGEFDSVELSDQDLPWEGAARVKNAASNWTQRVAVVDDAALDPRMRAQNGRFLIGGLARTYPETVRYLRGRRWISKEDHARVCSLSINFPMTKRPRSTAWAMGWSVLVEASWKPGLMRRLAAEPDPITRDTMYPPVNEVSRLARRVVEQRLQS